MPHVRHGSSLLYERTGLSLDKKLVIERARRQATEARFIDLVFYHRLLRCHLIIDLKVRHFQHSDAGQMNFYLNYWKREVATPEDNPPVGLLLCSDKDQTKVEYATGGLDQQLFVSRYLVALPKLQDIEQLIERDRALWERRIATNRSRPGSRPAV